MIFKEWLTSPLSDSYSFDSRLLFAIVTHIFYIIRYRGMCFSAYEYYMLYRAWIKQMFLMESTSYCYLLKAAPKSQVGHWNHRTYFLYFIKYIKIAPPPPDPRCPNPLMNPNIIFRHRSLSSNHSECLKLDFPARTANKAYQAGSIFTRIYNSQYSFKPAIPTLSLDQLGQFKH